MYALQVGQRFFCIAQATTTTWQTGAAMNRHGRIALLKQMM
jgi:hypothetical protein